MRRFLRNNGLSLALLALFALSLIGQSLLGVRVWNDEIAPLGGLPLSLVEYLHSGHYVESVFENWESEFLQMGIYVLLTVWLRQRGSAESRPLSDENTRVPAPDSHAPWPARRGGWWRRLYAQSLSIALFALFGLSFGLHLVGSWRLENANSLLRHEPAVGLWQHATSARFWFESFQNWQSEFLSILLLVLLSIWLRQERSPQSKPVDAPHAQTGA
jgi:hypothetical protein